MSVEQQVKAYRQLTLFLRSVIRIPYALMGLVKTEPELAITESIRSGKHSCYLMKDEL